jgi:D-arabinose 5-phosphate isomerase GutQ
LVNHVPANEIDALIDNLKASGATVIKMTKNPDGTFDVEAEFED